MSRFDVIKSGNMDDAAMALMQFADEFWHSETPVDPRCWLVQEVPADG